MPKKRTRKEAVEQAADALKDLNMYYAIIALLESSLISSSHQVTDTRIISMCKREAGKCLADYDRCVAEAAG